MKDVSTDGVRAVRNGRHRAFVIWIASAVVLAGVAMVLTVRALTAEGGDVADRPGATVWVKSVVCREEGKLRLTVDPSAVRISDGDEILHPQWMHAASEISTSVTQSGDADTAHQTVKGAVAYVAFRQRWNLMKLRRESVVDSSTFEFTGEFVAEPGGIRWWRVRRVEPSAGGPSLVQSK